MRWSVVLCCAAVCGSAHGSLINGDFEDGLNGWTVTIEGPASQVDVTVEEDGNGGHRAALYFDWQPPPEHLNTWRVRLYQQFTITEPMILSFDYEAAMEADGSLNSSAGISYSGTNVLEGTFNTFASYSRPFSSGSAELKLLPGTGTIEARSWWFNILNLGTGTYRSGHVYLSNVQLTPFEYTPPDPIVPEPSAFVLALCGLAVLIHRGSRSKIASRF